MNNQDLTSGLIPYSTLTVRLHMSRPALDKLASDPFEGFPPRIRLGRKFWISEQEVARWIRERTSSDAFAGAA